MTEPETRRDPLREAFIEEWYALLGEVDDAIVRGGWRIDEVGTEEVFDKHRHAIEEAAVALASSTQDALDVEALGTAMHHEWDVRVGEPSEPGVRCGDCDESAERVATEYAAIRAARGQQ